MISKRFSILLLTTNIITHICNQIFVTSTTITTNYLLSCGATTPTITSTRLWSTDNNPVFAPSSALSANTTVATPTTNDPLAAKQVPCTTARIFHSPFTYSFPVTPGPKFIRLYFCSDLPYNNTLPSQFFMSLKADGGTGTFTLFDNFSAYLYHHRSNNSLSPHEVDVIEFLLDVNGSFLNLTFSPSSTSPSLGVINGIEILHVPHGLYETLSPREGPSPCQKPKMLDMDMDMEASPRALQTMARINVGDKDVQQNEDSGGLSRLWLQDNKFLVGDLSGTTTNIYHNQKIKYTTQVPIYTAPDVVYSTARDFGHIKMKNISWIFPVDIGFDYLIRLHFCEIYKGITNRYQRVFEIFVNDQRAELEADVMDWSSEAWGTPVCKDYVYSMYGDDKEHGSIVPLMLSLTPNSLFKVPDVILNGVEIFKVSHQFNLTAPNPPFPDSQNGGERQPRTTTKTNHKIIRLIICGVLGCMVVVCSLVTFFVWGKCGITTQGSTTSSNKKVKWLSCLNDSGSNTTNNNRSASLPSHLCHRFSLHEIKVATRNFDDEFVIGRGGFGKVYKGSISNLGDKSKGDPTLVAIKRLNPCSSQGAHEFRTEIEMLSKLRHLHLVSFIGYCYEESEMILVYEYMALGSLQDHLYEKRNGINIHNNPSLPWKQRLKICLGAARGLHYLHVGTNQAIIHRDIKSTNILLDRNWVAKVSDFGLSKVGPADEAGEYVSTKVKGSLGYLDPEYCRSYQLSIKSDVYSFGVVLLEALSGRSVVSPGVPKEQVNLVLWAESNYKIGSLNRIVDPRIRGEIATECFSKFGEVAYMCVREKGSERPSMGDVVWGLEFALKLQQNAEDSNSVRGASFGGLLQAPHSVDENHNVRGDEIFNASY